MPIGLLSETEGNKEEEEEEEASTFRAKSLRAGEKHWAKNEISHLSCGHEI